MFTVILDKQDKTFRLEKFDNYEDVKHTINYWIANTTDSYFTITICKKGANTNYVMEFIKEGPGRYYQNAFHENSKDTRQKSPMELSLSRFD